jgi:Xaa-Pro aminopeptidase
MNKIEFAKRRQELMNIIGEGSIAIVPTAPEQIRNCDVHYSYRQDSNFYYLTGFTEPQALAVIIPQRAQGQYLLFCSENDQEQERWSGNSIGLNEARKVYDADDAFPITDIDDIVPRLMEKYHHIYYPIGYYSEFDNKVTEWISQLRNRIGYVTHIQHKVVALDHILHEMRLIKTRAEIQEIRTASNITVRAHKRAMKFCRQGLFEYQVEAEINHEITNKGCASMAFPTIVASGKNSFIFHYTKKDSKLKNGDLILVDAGAEFKHYASDITRTFPINGGFTSVQKTIYELVLNVQQAALSEIYPGNSIDKIYQTAINIVTKGLIEIGLLVGEFEYLIEQEAYKLFYVSHISHWLGIDVHDPGNYKIDGAWRVLEPGMVLTVEPGIYIPTRNNIPKKWWNICIRIEDVVLVTKTGFEVLSADMPKTVNEIENFMAISPSTMD